MTFTRITTFLRNFPAWIVLFVLTLIFVIFYKTTGDIAYKEWTSLILASLFTALGVKAQGNQSANTTTGDVNITPETENNSNGTNN